MKKSKWKNTEIWKAMGKTMDTNTGGRTARIPEPVLIA